ncbi:hypothetical protein AVDCRST_MAG94-5517 [uncultured Leptolyngbya sp.]|uniref:Uncharacterized protein n=1 Tax=uncultured Leptolyngbya sp. TaxID=332963 RepID=A0A6J4NP89_9CYAN|nr:hypothetical protein AVDCRST_MAG94-5517 [uncultured Leptolyngbya sp.]
MVSNLPLRVFCLLEIFLVSDTLSRLGSVAEVQLFYCAVGAGCWFVSRSIRLGGVA